MTTEAKTEKKRAINRVQAVYQLRALVDKMYQSSQEAQKEGRPVAWCMLEGGIGHPFLRAMGMEAVWPENFGPVCAASGAARSFLDRSDAEGYPSHLCGYCRNILGYAAKMKELGTIPPEAPAGGMPKPALLLATGRTCDTHSKVMQALGRYLDTPVWIIEQPFPGMREELAGDTYERDVKFMVKELREFTAFLEKLLGKKMDWDEFSRIVDGGREMDAMWYKVNELRKNFPGPMHSRDFWSSISPSQFGTSHPEEVLVLYTKLYEEVKERVKNKISGINYPEKYRLVFQGLPPWHSLGFFDLLAERGWNFVTESNYHPPKPRDMSAITDPVERLVRHRIPGLSWLIDDAFGAEGGKKIKEEIRQKGFSPRQMTKDAMDYQVDGAVLHILLTCRPRSSHLPLMQQMFMNDAKIPSLTLEGDIVDARLFDTAAALRKAEAFEETMEHYRELRKKEGLY